jgi:2-hydroxychromene-2-carboxylate isomerase
MIMGGLRRGVTEAPVAEIRGTMEGVEPARLIEVFADVVCPFTHVGLRRLVAHRAQMHRDDVAIRVRAWPLELVNGEQVPQALLVEEVAELRQTVASDLFTAFDPERFPMSSLPALALAATAYRSDLKRGEQVSLALREALFEEGRDLTDPTELLQIGQLRTLDDIRSGEAEVRADHAEGRARGVIGSPHFFVDGEGFFCPTLAIERVGGHLSISFDTEGFDEFIERCFRSR